MKHACRVALFVVGLACAPGARGADVHVMLSGGFAAAYGDLVPLYERQSGHRVVTARGPSMGDTREAIPKRLERGEPCDVVIVAGEAVDALVDQGRVMRGSRVDLARAEIAMAVRSGVALPDIGSADAFRRVLFDAPSIAVSDSASGVYLQKTLFPTLDENGKLAAKTKMIPAEPVGQVVARGEAAIGFQQRSELQPVRGIEVVGAIPGEFQKITVFAAGIATNAKENDAARDFVRFLASRDAQAPIIKSGMEPASATISNAPRASELKDPPRGTEMTKQPGHAH